MHARLNFATNAMAQRFLFDNYFEYDFPSGHLGQHFFNHKTRAKAIMTEPGKMLLMSEHTHYNKETDGFYDDGYGYE